MGPTVQFLSKLRQPRWRWPSAACLAVSDGPAPVTAFGRRDLGISQRPKNSRRVQELAENLEKIRVGVKRDGAIPMY